MIFILKYYLLLINLKSSNWITKYDDLLRKAENGELTHTELEDIKSIKQEYSNLSLSLGEIELSINNLNNQKQYFLEIHKQLFEKENELAKILNEKYGIGTINIETGVIE
jgi:hypothetical protein